MYLHTSRLLYSNSPQDELSIVTSKPVTSQSRPCPRPGKKKRSLGWKQYQPLDRAASEVIALLEDQSLHLFPCCTLSAATALCVIITQLCWVCTSLKGSDVSFIISHGRFDDCVYLCFSIPASLSLPQKNSIDFYLLCHLLSSVSTHVISAPQEGGDWGKSAPSVLSTALLCNWWITLSSVCCTLLFHCKTSQHTGGGDNRTQPWSLGSDWVFVHITFELLRRPLCARCFIQTFVCWPWNTLACRPVCTSPRINTNWDGPQFRVKHSHCVRLPLYTV